MRHLMNIWPRYHYGEHAVRGSMEAKNKARRRRLAKGALHTRVTQILRRDQAAETRSE